ncbi:MAG TPA: GlsB/YeaQ/YmgE family stress response membrane protein [Hyphomicrobiaceae bacterium]|mgnify:FL=1|nr:MAG: GlsB/YeaQ/YmgE family stress response membrane protein [Pseudomonadota bacterium]HEX5600800.1 GlsB/YeaQ/YmgE family stress response membrane protein [Hyphomicrobiaceae bacterium]
MSILAWIVVGLIAGWIAEQITGREHGLLTNLLVGIIGAFVGGFLFSTLLGFEYREGFNIASIVVATVGAIVFLFILSWFRGEQRTIR